MEILELLKKHLAKPKFVVAVTQDDNKLSRPNAKVDKYNWSKEDIVQHFGSLENFLKSLKDYGFTNGTIISFRRRTGQTTILIKRVVLKFKGDEETDNQNQIMLNEEENSDSMQKSHQTQEQMDSSKSNGLGYANVPYHELVTLNVMRERYSDLSDKLRRAEKERDKAETDLRLEKEKTFELERKINTLEDKWEMKLLKKDLEKKSFFDSEAGLKILDSSKEIAQALAVGLGGFSTPKASLGNPMANLPESVQQIMVTISDWDEKHIELLGQTIHCIANFEGFSGELAKGIEKYLNQK